MIPNPYIIHMMSCKEREQTQKHLEDAFATKIQIFPALVPGNNWFRTIRWTDMNSPTKCHIMKPGQIGCNLSHYTLYKSLTGRGLSTIFEDDAKVNNIRYFISFMNAIKGKDDYDIILLGYSNLLEGDVFDAERYRIVKSFWGTHAMILTEKARQCFIDEYDTMMEEDTCLPTDRLWSHCIKKYGLRTYAPLVPAVIYSNELISLIDGIYKRWDKNL